MGRTRLDGAGRALIEDRSQSPTLLRATAAARKKLRIVRAAGRGVHLPVWETEFCAQRLAGLLGPAASAERRKSSSWPRAAPATHHQDNGFSVPRNATPPPRPG